MWPTAGHSRTSIIPVSYNLMPAKVRDYPHERLNKMNTATATAATATVAAAATATAALPL